MGCMIYTVPLEAELLLKLFFENKVNLCVEWPENQAKNFLDMVMATPYHDILDFIDHSYNAQPLETEYIPQFANTTEIDDVVQILTTCGEDTLSYPDLGYYLIRSERKRSAYAKYGENYGKGAALLGLACYDPGTIRRSVLSEAYLSEYDAQQRTELRCKLYLRIPLIQELLCRAKTEKYNGYDSMRMFSATTMRRRGQSPRKLFGELVQYGDESVQKRIENIYWEE